MSEKRRDENEVRREVLRDLVKKRGWRCEARIEAVCTGEAQDGHERLRRSAGGSIVDEGNIMLVCRACHSWIHSWPVLARERGLLASRYDAAKDLVSDEGDV